jgi:hypothetical protein
VPVQVEVFHDDRTERASGEEPLCGTQHLGSYISAAISQHHGDASIEVSGDDILEAVAVEIPRSQILGAFPIGDRIPG